MDNAEKEYLLNNGRIKLYDPDDYAVNIFPKINELLQPLGYKLEIDEDWFRIIKNG